MSRDYKRCLYLFPESSDKDGGLRSRGGIVARTRERMQPPVPEMSEWSRGEWKADVCAGHM